MVEYDQSMLAPLGLVVGFDELAGKTIAVIDSGLDKECIVSDEEGMYGYDCGGEANREQAVIMIDDEGSIVVIQPNENGSYWRKIVRNKMVLMKEVRRVKASREYTHLVLNKEEEDIKLVSTWGPYMTTSGTAKKTGVAGLTAPANL